MIVIVSIDSARNMDNKNAYKPICLGMVFCTNTRRNPIAVRVPIPLTDDYIDIPRAYGANYRYKDLRGDKSWLATIQRIVAILNIINIRQVVFEDQRTQDVFGELAKHKSSLVRALYAVLSSKKKSNLSGSFYREWGLPVKDSFNIYEACGPDYYDIDRRGIKDNYMYKECMGRALAAYDYASGLQNGVSVREVMSGEARLIEYLICRAIAMQDKEQLQALLSLLSMQAIPFYLTSATGAQIVEHAYLRPRALDFYNMSEEELEREYNDNHYISSWTTVTLQEEERVSLQSVLNDLAKFEDYPIVVWSRNDYKRIRQTCVGAPTGAAWTKVKNRVFCLEPIFQALMGVQESLDIKDVMEAFGFGYKDYIYTCVTMTNNLMVLYKALRYGKLTSSTGGASKVMSLEECEVRGIWKDRLGLPMWDMHEFLPVLLTQQDSNQFLRYLPTELPVSTFPADAFSSQGLLGEGELTALLTRCPVSFENIEDVYVFEVQTRAQRAAASRIKYSQSEETALD